MLAQRAGGSLPGSLVVLLRLKLRQDRH